MVSRLHHFVSQCYLKGFTPDRNKKSRLFVMHAQSKRAANELPSNVAKERDFNSVDIEGQPSDALENALSGFETVLDKALENVIGAKIFQGEDDRAYILNLIVMLILRNPRFREQRHQFMESSSKMLMDITLASKERWENTVKKMKKDGINLPEGVSYEELKEFFEKGEYTFEVPVMRHLQTEFEIFDDILPLFFKRKWSLLKASADSGGFISSDHPVCLVWSDGKSRGQLFPPGFGLTGTDLIFPLSKDLLLLGRFEGQEDNLEVNPVSVAIFNRIIAAHAKRQIYSSTKNFLFVKSDGKIGRGKELFDDPIFQRKEKKAS